MLLLDVAFYFKTKKKAKSSIRLILYSTLNGTLKLDFHFLIGYAKVNANMSILSPKVCIKKLHLVFVTLNSFVKCSEVDHYYPR